MDNLGSVLTKPSFHCAQQTTDFSPLSPTGHVFLSYSRVDIEFARYLRTLLEHEGRLNIWMDEKRLSAGDNWWKTIERSIDACSAFVIIMSPASDESRYVHAEILRAFDKSKPIFPVLLEGSVFSLLASLQYEDMRSGLTSTLSSTFLSRIQSKCGIAPMEEETSRKKRKYNTHSITLKVVCNDVTSCDCDVLLLKYAEDFYGADEAVASRIEDFIDEDHLSAKVGNHVILKSNDYIAAKHVVFVSTCPLHEFEYGNVRELSTCWLRVLAKEVGSTMDDIKHIAMTMHGIDMAVGTELDISQSLEAQITGLVDALRSGSAPSHLKTISMVERFPSRVREIVWCLDRLFQDIDLVTKVDTSMCNEPSWVFTIPQEETDVPATMERSKKPFALIILPDDDSSNEDYFHYGIQRPIHAMGLLCERISIAAATTSRANAENCDNDDPERKENEKFEGMLEHMGRASFIICDASKIEEHYLHFLVGYSFGRGIPTVVLNPPQTTNGEKINNNAMYYLYKNHIRYDKIWQLEEGLRKWLQSELQQKQLKHM